VENAYDRATPHRAVVQFTPPRASGGVSLGGGKRRSSGFGAIPRGRGRICAPDPPWGRRGENPPERHMGGRKVRIPRAGGETAGVRRVFSWNWEGPGCAQETSWGAQESSWGVQDASWGAQEASWGAREPSWGAQEASWSAREASWGAQEASWGMQETSCNAVGRPAACRSRPGARRRQHTPGPWAAHRGLSHTVGARPRPNRAYVRKCARLARKGRHVLRTRAGRRPSITYVRKYARLARKGRQALRSRSSLRLKHCFVIQGGPGRLIYVEGPTRIACAGP